MRLSVIVPAALVSAFLASDVRAEMARFRYIPVDACGKTAQVPIGPGGALGELSTGFGLRPEPFPRLLRPTHMVTFRHAYLGSNVTLPLALPEGTPRIEHRGDAIVYNYGSYTVRVQFYQDGSMDVMYNSGFLRRLPI